MAEPFRYKPRREKLHVDDEGLLEQLMKLGAQLPLSTGVDAAAEVLGCSRSTLYQFIKDNPEAKEAWKRGRVYAKLKFAKRGEDLAMVDPGTWRFLAKHKRYLGLSDEPKAAKPLPSSGGDPEGTIAPATGREENIKRVAELFRKIRAPIDIDGQAEEVRPAANHGTTGRGIVRR